MFADRVRKLRSNKRVSTSELLIIVDELFAFTSGLIAVMDNLKKTGWEDHELTKTIEMGLEQSEDRYTGTIR